MVEIALSLAIIGFALIAIIGILPAGMSVQKDNREQTVIDLDAAYLMNVIRNGSLGQDNLPNYIMSLTQTITPYSFNSLSVGPQSITNTYYPGNQLTNGAVIIGMLSIPKFWTNGHLDGPTGFFSNNVTAVFRAINAPAVDQGQSQASQNFAFQYQVTVEIIPSAEYAYVAANGTWANLTAPTAISSLNGTEGPLDEPIAENLQNNLWDIRLTFRWPVLPNGQLGGGKQVFRSTVAGHPNFMEAESPPYYSTASNLYFMQPLSYQAY